MEGINTPSRIFGSLRDFTRVLVGYSGGVDSTFAALALSERFEKIHLVTYKTNTLIFLANAAKNAAILKERLAAGRVDHGIIDIRPLCGKFTRGCSRDYFTYCGGSAPAVFLMAYRLAMHTRNIIYCLEHGVPVATDGSVRTQSDRPEMMPRVLDMLARFYSEYNVRFVAPVYDFGSKEAQLALLRERGFLLGPRFGESHFPTIQPVCLLGPFYAVWHLTEPNTEEQLVPYVQAKLEVARDVIDEYFESRGADPRVLMSKLPAVEAGEIATFSGTDGDVKISGVLGGRRDEILGNTFRPLWWCFRQALRVRASVER